MNEFCKDKSHVNHFWEWKKETNDPLIQESTIIIN